VLIIIGFDFRSMSEAIFATLKRIKNIYVHSFVDTVLSHELPEPVAQKEEAGPL
jgi:hypothetical protein